MTHLAIIEGVSGSERYLAAHGEVAEVKRAKRFRTERAAEEAAKDHIAAFPRVIQRAMKYRVIPVSGS